MEKKNNEGAVDIDQIHDTLPGENFNHRTQNWCATGILGCNIGYYPFQNNTLLISIMFQKKFLVLKDLKNGQI